MEEKQLNSMAEYYEEWWENPRDPRGRVFAKLNQLVGNRIPKTENGEALDLGSGCGAIIERLATKGYNVTGVEYGKEAAQKLKMRFPKAEIVQADLNKWEIDRSYELVTAIELVQNFTEEELLKLLIKIKPKTKRLIITCPNYNSLQGRWVTWRKFKAPFVHLYRPRKFEEIVEKAGFKITYRAGVGFLMPITLLSGFKVQLIPSFMVKYLNKILDPIFPKLCALYYIEVE